jgi:hypothetical protein
MIASWEVEVAVANRLRTVPGFELFDGEAPQKYEGDHIVWGDGTGAPRNAFGRRGKDVTETVHAWTRGNSNQKARGAAEQIRAALEDAPLVTTGDEVALVRQEFVTLEKEPGWRHVVMRFRLHVRTV